MLSKFNGTLTPKGSYRPKTGDNGCNINSSRYSLSTALCESIRYLAKSEQNVGQDLIPRGATWRLLSSTPDMHIIFVSASNSMELLPSSDAALLLAGLWLHCCYHAASALPHPWLRFFFLLESLRDFLRLQMGCWFSAMCTFQCISFGCRWAAGFLPCVPSTVHTVSPNFNDHESLHRKWFDMVCDIRPVQLAGTEYKKGGLR